MKKVKIMLLSLALFAVVGGALAFKAKFDQRWCITEPYVNGTCTTLFQEAITTTQCAGILGGIENTDGPAVFACTTIPGLNENCNRLCPEYKKTTTNE